MIATLKNQSPFIITIATLAAMALIMFLPTEVAFEKVINDEFKLEYVDLTFKMGFLFLIGYSFIRRMKTQALGGLSKEFSWRFKYLNLIPVYLFIIGILSINSQDFSLINPVNLILLLFACLMVGFAEEYLFRGLLLPLFLKKYGMRANGIFISILLTSLFFGVFHLINLTKGDPISQVLVQVIFASFIGFFFGALLLKTKKLIPISITHGLINFFFSLSLLPAFTPFQDETNDTVSFAPIILFLPLFIVGLLIYKKLDKKEIIETLNLVKDSEK